MEIVEEGKRARSPAWHRLDRMSLEPASQAVLGNHFGHERSQSPGPIVGLDGHHSGDLCEQHGEILDRSGLHAGKHRHRGGDVSLSGQLGGPGPSISLADLLLSKLQVWEINRKDLGDALCLLADHALAGAARAGDALRGDAADADEISLARLAAVLGADWGFCHTVERNLGKVTELWTAEPVPGAPHDVTTQAAAIRSAIDAAPKSRAWRMRARIGERVKWYETPEEVRH